MIVRPLMAALVGLALLGCIGAGLVAFAYLRDMRHAYERIGARGEVIASPFGDCKRSVAIDGQVS